MDNKTYVLAELKRRKGQVKFIAERTEINRRTITYFQNGRDIRASTLQKLYDFLKLHQRKKVLNEQTIPIAESAKDSPVGAP